MMGEIAPYVLTSEETEPLAPNPEVVTSPKQPTSIKYGSHVDVPGGNGDLAPVLDI